MAANFTTGALAQDVAEIGARVSVLFSLAECDLTDGDARAVAADIVNITKELELVRAQIRAVTVILRRSAMLLLTLQDLAAATGKSADPDAFFSACSAEALDYLVALRKAGRAECNSFYLECHAKAAAYKTNP